MLDSLFRLFDNMIVLDVETTGFDAAQDEIIELAALRLQKQQDAVLSVSELDMLVKLPEGRRLPSEITGLTGITEIALETDGFLKAEACRKFLKFIDGSKTLIVAYNAQFDLGFIHQFLNCFGKADLLNSAGFLDAMTVYKDRRPYPHKLSDAVSAYSLKTQNTHRAIDDVKATFELLCALENECDDLPFYVNLFGYNPRYGVKGPKIASVRYLPQPFHAVKKLYEQ